VSATRVRYRDAVAEALRMEMHRDPAVVLLEGARDESGDGTTGATRGFRQLFGERFVTLPVGSDSIVGTAAGAAAAGMRPVCEIPLAEFGAGALGELTRVAELCRAERVELPLLLRIPLGGLESAGAADGALDPETWLLGLGEVRVVAPATPEDAKGMITSALHQPGPVCLLEHEALEDVVGPVPEGRHRTPLDEARVVREGERLTLTAFGPAVLLAERAARKLGDDVEVIDLRSLQPLDDATILASVRRTGKLLIVAEANRSFRVSGEVAALVTERAFEYLDAPPRRIVISAPDAAAMQARDETPPAVTAIRKACRELLGY
jgi:acetoin:2,6-dichlorophenolindophenol oxidoreductase subunit beta